MRQNADGTWSIVRKITYTTDVPGDFDSQMWLSRALGQHTFGSSGFYIVEDVTDSEPDKSKMPEPMPGMIVEFFVPGNPHPVRSPILQVCGSGVYVYESGTPLLQDWSNGPPVGVSGVWSPAHVLLWERSTP